MQPVLMRHAETEDEIATTWITAAELFYGAAKSRSPAEGRAAVLHFLASLAVVGLDEPSARVFGEIKATLEREGRRLDDADLLIGSIAIARDAIVVTGNRRHYERIPGIRIENWIER